MKKQPLLKDKIFERIEDSFTFKQDIFRLLNIEKDEEMTELLNAITEFVNQNYIPKTNDLHHPTINTK